jgi:hypothetical protein
MYVLKNVMLAKAINNPRIIGNNTLQGFEAKWCRKGLLCTRTGLSVR